MQSKFNNVAGEFNLDSNPNGGRCRVWWIDSNGFSREQFFSDDAAAVRWIEFMAHMHDGGSSYAG